MSVTVRAVGDIMLGDHPICIGHGVGSRIKKNGSRYLFQDIAPSLRPSDITFGNLEVVLSTAGLNPNSLRSVQLRAAPEAIEGLNFAKFNVLSLANNHVLDHGQEAFDETVSLLSKNGIICVGTRKDLEAFRPVMLHKNGVSIAILAYCSVPSWPTYQVMEGWEDQLLDAVARAASQADITIVSLHWGVEYVSCPSPSQIKFARQLIDRGAHLILGHHPHVLQGVEPYGQGLICYSLGNFVFDMWSTRTREGLVLRCELSPRGVEDWELVPVFIGKDYVPRVLYSTPGQELLARLKLWSEAICKEDFSEFEAKSEQYLSMAAACRAQYRKEVRRYFIGNFFKYRLSLGLQLVRDWLIRSNPVK